MRWYWYTLPDGQLCVGDAPEGSLVAFATPVRLPHRVCRSFSEDEFAIIGIPPEDWIITPDIEQRIARLARDIFQSALTE